MYIVIGIQNVDFKTPEGTRICGSKLFLTYPKDNVEGLACESCFVKDSISLAGIEVGDTVELMYNKFGKVQAVTLA